MRNANTTIRAEEAAFFSELARDWWNPKGKMASLHEVNPVRLEFLRDAIDRHWPDARFAAKPLQGKSALDIGCGAGLLCEPMARLGAELRSAFIDRGAWAVQLVLSTVSVLLLGATFAACTLAVGAPVQPLQLMFIAPVLFAVASLPVSVGGWGLREAAAASLYAAASLDPADGVAASAVYGAVNIVAALPGALTWLRSARAGAS